MAEANAKISPRRSQMAVGESDRAAVTILAVNKSVNSTIAEMGLTTQATELP
jgi:hypothetical protein